MARDSFNEQKNKNVYSTQKKKKKDEKTVVTKKPQSSSVVKPGVKKAAAQSGPQRVTDTGTNRSRTVTKSNIVKPGARKSTTQTGPQRVTDTGTNRSREQVAATSRDMMAQRQAKQAQRTTIAKRNAAEWNTVKNRSKDDQQAWFAQKAKEAQARHAAESGRKVDKGTDNLLTSAAKAAFHSGKGAVHSLAGALERSSMNDFYEGARYKYDAMRKGMSEEEAEKYGNEKAKNRQEARLAGFRQKTKLEQEKAEAIKNREAAKDSGAIPLRKWTVGAASFTGQRLVDSAAGPYSLLSMGARVLEDERNSGKEKNDQLKKRLADTGQFTQEELDEEFDKIDKRTVANAYASSGLELLSEVMFGGIGLSKKYLPEGASGLLDRAAGKLTGSLGSTALGRVALGIGEETAEEWIANPVQAAVSNRLTGNRLQSLQEESIRRAYQGQAKDLKEIQATAADINSDAFLERAKSIYKESGASDEEAAQIAELARDYFNADITGDAKTAEEKLNQITDILAGGENDLREKWTIKDALEVAGEMIISVGAEAAPGAISTSQTGSQYKANYGIDGVRKLAKVVENLDEEKSDRAKAIIDDIDSGKDVSNTQVAMLMEWSNEAALKAQDREIARDRLVQRKMRDEKLLVPIVDAEYNLAPATEARFEDIAERTADLAQDEMGFDMSDVDAYAIGDVVAAYETGTISAEQMNELNIENPENRAVFEEATGIDLGQYTVKDSNGNIKVAASNTAMQQALFAKAADNYIESARIEQENWNDVERGRAFEELTSNMDGMGGVGIQRVLESVDPRNRGDFLLAGSVARRVYEHARNTNDEWETVKKDFTDAFGADMNESMKYVFDMAKQAKAIAETKYYGKAVNKNSLNTEDVAVAEGKFTNESARELRGSEIGVFTSVASELGINVIMTDSLERNENGRYMPSQRTIMLNSANTMGDNLQAIFSHEVTHHLAVYAPDEYIKLSRFVMDRWYKSNPEEYNSEIQRIQDLYKKAKDQDLSPEEALEELIADGSRDFWQDGELINSVTTEEPSLAKSIINAIKSFLGKLRNILASGSITDDNIRDGFFAEIDAYDEAYRLWLNAYKAARSDSARQAIYEWQDKAFEETRNSVAEEKWERGEKLSQAKFNSFYSAHKLNYGASQKGDLQETIDSIKANGFTSNTALSNVVPASINDYVGEKPNYTQGLYGARKGDTVLLVPKPYLDQKNDTVKNGFKPRDYEIVEVERDFQPYYELYSKAYDENEARFSISEPVERVKDLIAVHNLKPDDIRNTFELGGFPMPSIAVTKDSMGHDLYGDITLMFHSDTIDPKRSRDNQVFGGDAWTPTFPPVAKKINRKVADRVDQKLRDILGLSTTDYTLGDLRLPALDDDNLTNSLRYNDPYDAFKNDEVFQIAYLKNAKNFDVAVPTKEGNIRGLNKQALEFLDDRLPELTHNDIYDTVDHTMEYEPAVREARKAYYEAIGGTKLKALSKMLDEKMGYSDVLTRLEATIKFREEGVPEVTDRDALDSILKEHVDEEGFKNWIDNLFEGIVEKTGIRNDKDMFTASGNRRSWESLHDPVTLENVVKVMKTELAAGGNGLFGSNPKGAAQKNYKSLDEIRSDESRLQSLPEEEYNAQSDQAVGKLAEVSQAIAEHNPKRFDNNFGFGAALDVGSYVAEILNSTRNRSTIQRKLKEDYWLDVTDDQMDDLMEAIEAIANLPTGYFEAKPRRAVGFDEVKAAIIPSSTDEDIKKGFNDRGIQMYEYDPDVEGDRTEKVNEAATEQDLRFSLTQEQQQRDEAYMSAVNSGNMDEAQRLVDEAAKMAGMRVAHRYHGTMNANFTVFDKAYAKVGGNSGAGFYFSTEEDDSANHYADVEGADNYYKWSDLAEAIWDTGELPNGEEADGIESYEDAVQFAKDYLNKSPGTYDVYLNYKNPYVRDFRQSTNIFPRLYDDFDESIIDRKDYDDEDAYYDDLRDAEIEHIAEKIHDAVYDAYYGMDSFYEIIEAPDLEEVVSNITEHALDYESITWSVIASAVSDSGWMEVIRDDWTQSGQADTELTRAIIENFGYDAIEDKEVSSKFGQLSREMMTDTEHIIVFKPEQIKLSDPVTYAEDGSVIPLSERFDPSKDDIRYSLPTTDSDGNILTDGQMEYFKNSQARDAEGKMQVVYHTTNYGGFTIFDPSYSDDKRSLFFASNFDVSQTYGRNADRKYRFEEYSFKSLNDFAKAYAENFSNNLNDPENDILEQVVNALRIHIEKNSMPAFDLGDTMFERVKNYMKIAEAGDVRADKYRIEMKGAYGGMVRASSYDELLGKLSRQMSNNSSKSGYYECYLNLENPLIVDAQNQSWNNIPYGEYSEDAVLAIKNLTVQDMGDGIYVNIWGDRKVDGKWQEFRESDTIEFEYLTVDGEYEIPERAWDEVYDFLVKQGLSSDYAYEHSDAFFDFNGLDTFDKDGRKVESDVRRYRTRELAALADAKGYDSVIVRNCYDIGAASHLKGEGLSDIYIAFSSNQVKDTRNENPTENPDIRYSITEEDEAMEWLASQYELDDVPLDDQVAEESRVRMAKSKQDFINSRDALWNERWLTEGKVLNTKSVEKSIRELVKGAMMNSDTSQKYKQDLVNKALVDAKSAYWLMKEDKHSEAADLLWDSAVKMIENVDFIEDENFKHYKDLRDYMRTTSFRLGEEYWSDVDFSAFRKRNFGRIKLVKGDTNIDDLYKELQEKWPEWFDEDEQMTPPDQLLRIEEVLDTIQPYKIAYSSEEAQEFAGDIASDLYDIVYQGEEYKSLADTYKERYDRDTKALKERHREALRNVRARRDELLAEEKGKTSRQKERAELWKSRTYEEKAKRQKDRDVRKKAKYFGKIADNIDWLTTRLINETKDKNIPEGFRKSLAHMLMQFDMQTERSKKLEEKYGPAKKTLKMRELRDRLKEIAKEDDTGEFRYDGYLFYLMDALADKVDGKPIDSLDTEDLIVIDTMLKSIKHNFRNYNKIRLEEEQVAVENIGNNTISMMEDRIQKYGKRRNRTGTPGYIDKLLNEGEQTPIYLFERLDPTGQGIGAMYKELRRGEDRHIQNMDFLRKRFQSMFQEYFNKAKPGSELESWRDESQSQTFDLEDGPITLNPAQMMSLYCLSKRPQAMGHILGSGIVASPVSVGSKLTQQIKGNDEQVNSVRITYSEIQEIISKLTPDQVKLADEMQSLLNNEMAAWGNETSLEMHGIKLFREKDYFPIKSSNEALAKTADSYQAQEKIKNFGFTKPLDRNANNAIMIDDIFSVVADHCNKMSLYNSMAIPISDFMRVYNYKQKREDGTVKTSVQAMIGDAFTRKVNDYIMKFIGDVNGNTQTRSDAVNDLMNKTLANYKKASIGANFRVALQQPTAIFRALMAIDAKYFVGIKPISPADVKEMFEHCPIALWKSWGHYDMDMGRDIEDIMMNNDWSRWDTVTMGAYGALDNWTWSLIWQAVKKEVKVNNPNVKEGTPEFWSLCNERASEVFDKTQVVDSIFHRSDTMRSKNTLTKMATSFMAEPTLTYNVFRDSLVKAREMLKDGDVAGATKLFTKMAFVLTLNAAAVSASAAIWDAVRGKGGDDDDDDEGLAELWLANFKQNFLDNAPWAQWNNVYFVKDIVSLKDGWGTSNMALEGFETIFKGMSQLKKKITEGSNKSWYDIFMNLLGGLGYVTGVPIKTIMRDVKAVFEKFGIDVFAADGTEEDESLMDTIADKMGYRPIQRKGDGDAKVKEGFFARFGIGKTEEEKEQDAFAEKTQTIKEKYADLSGEERDKKVWSSVTTYLKEQNNDKGIADFVAEGNYSIVRKYKQMYLEAGGDAEYFDSRIFDMSKKAIKKTIVYDPTEAQMRQQENIKEYLLSNGMDEAELSELAYKSDVAKDMKVAFRLNDKELMLESLEPLVNAGLTYDDLVRLWDNRNRMQLSSYKGRYKDKLKSTGTFVWPTEGVITSHFGYRNSPTAGASSNHPAIDIGAPMGTSVLAADGGVVIYAGTNGGYGNSVGIKHDNGMVTYYNHLSGWNVKVGDTVAQGQQIAAVGSTGISTGPHLDFKILDANGKPVDPEKYLNKRS